MGKDLKGKEIGKGIRQNKDGRYEARFTDRFGKRRSIYAKTKIEIKNKLAEKIKEDQDNKSIAKRYTVTQWYEEWMSVYKIPVIRPSTRKYYEGIFTRLVLPELGSMYLEDVRQIHVKALINKLNDKGYQWETQNKTRILLSDLFNVAIENNYILNNPTRGIKLAKNRPKDGRIYLTLEQQADFFECSAGTFYDNLFVVAVNTGLRPGEICCLMQNDINFAKKSIYVTKTLSYQNFSGDDKRMFHIGPPKTETSMRIVPINDACEKALMRQFNLKRLIAARHPNHDEEFKDLLFVTKFNGPICDQIFNDAIARIVNEINLQRDEIEQFPQFSAHTFRHTFATRCIEAGIAPKVLQKYLGHASLQMTMDLYVHVTEEFKQEEIKRLDHLVGSYQKAIPKASDLFADTPTLNPLFEEVIASSKLG